MVIYCCWDTAPIIKPFGWQILLCSGMTQECYYSESLTNEEELRSFRGVTLMGLTLTSDGLVGTAKCASWAQLCARWRLESPGVKGRLCQQAFSVDSYLNLLTCFELTEASKVLYLLCGLEKGMMHQKISAAIKELYLEMIFVSEEAQNQDFSPVVSFDIPALMDYFARPNFVVFASKLLHFPLHYC